MRRSPAFSALVIATLAIGIGANTALFSIIDRVLLHPFPYRDPQRLVDIAGRSGDGRPSGVTPAQFYSYKNRIHHSSNAPSGNGATSCSLASTIPRACGRWR